MIKDSYSNMASEIGFRSVDYGEDLVGNDLRFLLREREKDRGKRDIFRSPSAPPTIAGSLSATGEMFSGAGGEREVTEEDIRADPAYVDYYYSNVNMNPRLPPPLLSKEDWRFAHRANGAGGSPGFGGIGDRRKVNISNNNHSNNNNNNGVNSLFSSQPGFNNKENGVKGGEWSGVGLPGLGLGSRQKSIAEIIQDETIDISEAQFSAPLSSSDDLRQNISVSASVTYASALGGSLSRSTTPDPQLIGRAPSPRIPTAGEGRVNSMDKRNDLVSALSGMSLTNDTQSDHQRMFNLHGNHNHTKPKSHLDTSELGHFENHGISHSTKGSYSAIGKSGGISVDQNYYGLAEHHKHCGPNSPSNFHSVGSPSSAIPNYSLSGHSINPAFPSMMADQLGSGTFPPLFENDAALAMGVGPMPSRANLMAELQNPSRAGNISQMDPMYLHYLASINDPSVDGGASYMDMLALQKAYLGMLSPQKIDRMTYLGKSAGFNHGYYGNSGYGVNSPYVGNSFLSSLLPNSTMGSLEAR